MVAVTTRAGKNAPLTNDEIDANFSNLNTGKAEKSGDSFSGLVTFEQGIIAPGFSRRNRVHNGDMRVAQRVMWFGGATSYTPALNTVAFMIDRMACYFQNGVQANIQQFTRSDTDGRQKQWHIVTMSQAQVYATAGNINMPLLHQMDGWSVCDLAGKSITVSFQVIAAVAGIYSAALRTFNAAGTTVTGTCVKEFAVAAAGTPQRISITFPTPPQLVSVPSSNRTLDITLGGLGGSTWVCPSASLGQWTASNYLVSPNAVNWTGTANAQIGFTDLKLEEGPNATPFVPDSLADTYAQCYRFLEVGQQPVQYQPTNAGAYAAWYHTVDFKGLKWNYPTLYMQNFAYYNNGAVTGSTPTIIGVTPYWWAFGWVGAAGMNGFPSNGTWLATCEWS